MSQRFFSKYIKNSATKKQLFNINQDLLGITATCDAIQPEFTWKTSTMETPEQ